jgi:hypothetical protein
LELIAGHLAAADLGCSHLSAQRDRFEVLLLEISREMMLKRKERKKERERESGNVHYN